MWIFLVFFEAVVKKVHQIALCEKKKPRNLIFFLPENQTENINQVFTVSSVLQ